MSPSKSKTMVCPSGETSSDIQVPSSVVKETLPSGFRNNSSFFSSFFSSDFFSSWRRALTPKRKGHVASAANRDSPSNAYEWVAKGVRNIYSSSLVRLLFFVIGDFRSDALDHNFNRVSDQFPLDSRSEANIP